jgi:hypothetical protein
LPALVCTCSFASPTQDLAASIYFYCFI